MMAALRSFGRDWARWSVVERRIVTLALVAGVFGLTLLA
jgi:hypothetical protein